MASFTPNYNLEKPAEGEKYYISKFNANSDKVDTALQSQQTEITTNKTSADTAIANLRTEAIGHTDSEIASLETRSKSYTDSTVTNALNAHNSAENDTVHPYLQQMINDSLTEAKGYTYSKEEITDMIGDHNTDEYAHQDIRDAVDNIIADAGTVADNAISQHNIDPEAHQDIRSSIENAKTYAEEILEAHNTDPTAHGAMLTITGISSDGYETGTIDKSWNEVLNAFNSIRNVLLKLGEYDVKIISYNNVADEFYGSYFVGFDEHRVVIFKDENQIPRFVNYPIWAVSPYVDYGKADYMYLRT